MVPPKPKPVELAPNAGLAVVPKPVAVVTAAAPQGTGGGVGLEAGVDDAPLPPKGNGFGGGAAEEPKLDCGAEEPKVGCAAEEPKVDCAAEGPKVDCAAEEPKVDCAAEEPNVDCAAGA